MRGNPLKDLLSDNLFFELKSRGFLNERAIRDLYMKQKFDNLRNNMPPKRIFGMLQEEFPYLSVDTVRKIIYSRTGYDS